MNWRAQNTLPTVQLSSGTMLATSTTTPLAAPGGLDTTRPGLTRRRVWAAPAVRSHALLCLTLSKLYLAPNGSIKPDAIRGIEMGADLDYTFGPLGTVIDLLAITHVQLDLVRNALTIHSSRQGMGNGRAAGPMACVSIEFADYESADEVYTKVWRRVAERLVLKPVKRDVWEQARVPVAFMAGVLVATLALSLLANALADSGGTSSSTLAPFAAADWRWVCGFGGAVLAGLQIWLYRRVTKPPQRLELVLKSNPTEMR